MQDGEVLPRIMSHLRSLSAAGAVPGAFLLVVDNAEDPLRGPAREGFVALVRKVCRAECADCLDTRFSAYFPS